MGELQWGRKKGREGEGIKWENKKWKKGKYGRKTDGDVVVQGRWKEEEEREVGQKGRLKKC